LQLYSEGSATKNPTYNSQRRIKLGRMILLMSTWDGCPTQYPWQDTFLLALCPVSFVKLCLLEWVCSSRQSVGRSTCPYTVTCVGDKAKLQSRRSGVGLKWPSAGRNGQHLNLRGRINLHDFIL
jgi:hypothetical protein